MIVRHISLFLQDTREQIVILDTWIIQVSRKSDLLQVIVVIRQKSFPCALLKVTSYSLEPTETFNLTLSNLTDLEE